MSEVLERANGILLESARKMVSLGTEASQRLIVGKEAKTQDSTGALIAKFLTCYKQKANLTTPQKEAVLYELLSLSGKTIDEITKTPITVTLSAGRTILTDTSITGLWISPHQDSTAEGSVSSSLSDWSGNYRGFVKQASPTIAALNFFGSEYNVLRTRAPAANKDILISSQEWDVNRLFNHDFEVFWVAALTNGFVTPQVQPLGVGNGAFTHHFVFENFNNDGTIDVLYQAGVGNGIRYRAAAYLKTGAMGLSLWHMVFGFSTNTFKLEINGVDVGATRLSGVADIGSIDPSVFDAGAGQQMGLGGIKYGSTIDDDLDTYTYHKDLVITNRLLTATERMYVANELMQ